MAATRQETAMNGTESGGGTMRAVVHGESVDRVRSVARVTGWWYLALAVTGLGGALIRGQLYVAGDAARTAANLVDHEGLARLGIASDLGVVVTQVLAAIWFFILFRRVHVVAAGSITALGLASAVIVLGATTFSATALKVALDGGAADQALLLSHLQDTAWLMGGIFFGLWLIPMGWLARRSGAMRRPLGWLLMAGGAGYVLSTYARYLLPDATVLANALILPATAGELWMVGHLLIRGVSTAGVAVAAEQRGAAAHP